MKDLLEFWLKPLVYIVPADQTDQILDLSVVGHDNLQESPVGNRRLHHRQEDLDSLHTPSSCVALPNQR